MVEKVVDLQYPVVLDGSFFNYAPYEWFEWGVEAYARRCVHAVAPVPGLYSMPGVVFLAKCYQDFRPRRIGI